jgi:hypothetical protein
MDKQQLAKSLEQLHDQLSRVEQVDSETLARIRTLNDDIDRLLEEGGLDAGSESGPVSSGFRDLVLKFEAEHPQLSVALGRVADALAAMGI